MNSLSSSGMIPLSMLDDKSNISDTSVGVRNYFFNSIKVSIQHAFKTCASMRPLTFEPPKFERNTLTE